MIEIFRLILALLNENHHDVTPICSTVDVNGVRYYIQDRYNSYIAIRHNFGLYCPSSEIRKLIKRSQVDLRDKAGNNQPRMRIRCQIFDIGYR